MKHYIQTNESAISDKLRDLRRKAVDFVYDHSGRWGAVREPESIDDAIDIHNWKIVRRVFLDENTNEYELFVLTEISGGAGDPIDELVDEINEYLKKAGYQAHVYEVVEKSDYKEYQIKRGEVGLIIRNTTADRLVESQDDNNDKVEWKPLELIARIIRLGCFFSMNNFIRSTYFDPDFLSGREAIQSIIADITTDKDAKYVGPLEKHGEIFDCYLLHDLGGDGPYKIAVDKE